MVTNFLRGRSDLNPVYALSLEWAKNDESNRLANYRLYQDYYDGNHTVEIPEKIRKVLSTHADLKVNFCEVIVDSLAERLTVTGFACDDEAQAKRAWEIWKRNRLDEGSDAVHTQAINKGDGFVMVDFDRENLIPRIRYQSPESIRVEYEDSSNTVIARASKRWSYVSTNADGKPITVSHLNVYYPDRIEKYIAEGDESGSLDYAPLIEKDENGKRAPWPLPWVDGQGKPLGVPIFHFRNKAIGDEYGRSEIDNTIPQQDAFNKAVIDLMVVMDTMGFPQRWISGAKAPAGGFAVGPGVTLVFESSEAKAGTFEAAELDGMITAINTLLGQIATRSRTPAYMFVENAEYPSGEALKTAESGLVKKAEKRSVSFGNNWEDVILFALKLDNVFNRAKWNLAAMLETQWGEFETRNELLHTQAVMLRREVVGDRQAMREMGYSEQEISKILEEKAEDTRNAQTLGNALIDGFLANDRGRTDLNVAQVAGASQDVNQPEPDDTQPPRFSGR